MDAQPNVSILGHAVELVEWLNEQHFPVDTLSEAVRRLRNEHTRREDAASANPSAGAGQVEVRMRSIKAHLALLQGGLLPALRIADEQGFRDLTVSGISYIAACFRYMDEQRVESTH